MTFLATVSVALTLFHDQHFGAFALLIDSANNAGPSNERLANGYFLVVAEHQNVIKSDVLTCVCGEFFNDDLIAFGNFILFATCLNDREHGARPSQNSKNETLAAAESGADMKARINTKQSTESNPFPHEMQGISLFSPSPQEKTPAP